MGIAKNQLVGVSAIASQRVVLYWHGPHTVGAHGCQHLVCKLYSLEFCNHVQACCLTAGGKAAAKLLLQALQQVQTFTLVELAHFPDVPLQRAVGDESGKGPLRKGVCVHVCELLFFYPAGNKRYWNYGKANAQGRSQNFAE